MIKQKQTVQPQVDQSKIVPSGLNIVAETENKQA
jgi:hypothetical protein